MFPPRVFGILRLGRLGSPLSLRISGAFVLLFVAVMGFLRSPPYRQGPTYSRRAGLTVRFLVRARTDGMLALRVPVGRSVDENPRDARDSGRVESSVRFARRQAPCREAARAAGHGAFCQVATAVLGAAAGLQRRTMSRSRPRRGPGGSPLI